MAILNRIPPYTSQRKFKIRILWPVFRVVTPESRAPARIREIYSQLGEFSHNKEDLVYL